MPHRLAVVAANVLAVFLAVSLSATAQQKSARPQVPGIPAQKVRDGVFLVGIVEVDTVKKELTVPATINSGVTTLEFVANTMSGAKAYESALTVMADAYEFNTAMLLLGVDPAHARVPKFHFDPTPPAGDPLDVFVSWTAGGVVKRIRVEELLFDERTKMPLAEGPWVYTGSSSIGGRYMAALDGVLIGFVHSPSPIIENPRGGAVSAYGSVVFNTRLGLSGGTPVTLTVKAIPAKGNGR